MKNLYTYINLFWNIVFTYIYIYLFITENILKYYRVFDLYVPPKMMQKSKGQTLIGDTIDKIRQNLEIDKYRNEQRQIGKS